MENLVANTGPNATPHAPADTFADSLADIVTSSADADPRNQPDPLPGRRSIV